MARPRLTEHKFGATRISANNTYGRQDLPSCDPNRRWQAVIEASKGSHYRFRYRAESGCFETHALLPPGMRYPCDIGFIFSTGSNDSPLLEVLLLSDAIASYGTVVPCRLIGIIEAVEKSRSSPWTGCHLLLAVSTDSSRYARCFEHTDLLARQIDDLEYFLTLAKQYCATVFKPIARRSGAEAEQLVRRAETLAHALQRG